MSAKESFFIANPTSAENERVHLFPLNVEFSTRKGCFNTIRKLHIIYVVAVILAIGALVIMHQRHKKKQDSPYALSASWEPSNYDPDGNMEIENLAQTKFIPIERGQVVENEFQLVPNDDQAEENTIQSTDLIETMSEDNKFRPAYLTPKSDGNKFRPSDLIESSSDGNNFSSTDPIASTSEGNLYRPAADSIENAGTSEGNTIKPIPEDVITSASQGMKYKSDLIENERTSEGNTIKPIPEDVITSASQGMKYKSDLIENERTSEGNTIKPIPEDVITSASEGTKFKSANLIYRRFNQDT